jgi:deazaflavin-dependent oxidoreductase (nitroreductase family)
MSTYRGAPPPAVHASGSTRPLLGLRRRPGRLALAAMRLPRQLYHRGWGRLLGHAFLLIVHQGRKSGKRRETVAMAATYDAATKRVVVCSAWGETEWIRNLRVRPALEIQIGGDRFVPQQQFLSQDEAVAAVLEFRARHPGRLRLFETVLGWGDLSSEDAVRSFVRSRPFVAFRADGAAPLRTHGGGG